jgi:hypothetical protein
VQNNGYRSLTQSSTSNTSLDAIFQMMQQMNNNLSSFSTQFSTQLTKMELDIRHLNDRIDEKSSRATPASTNSGRYSIESHSSNDIPKTGSLDHFNAHKALNDEVLRNLEPFPSTVEMFNEQYASITLQWNAPIFQHCTSPNLPPNASSNCIPRSVRQYEDVLKDKYFALVGTAKRERGGNKRSGFNTSSIGDGETVSNQPLKALAVSVVRDWAVVEQKGIPPTEWTRELISMTTKNVGVYQQKVFQGLASYKFMLLHLIVFIRNAYQRKSTSTQLSLVDDEAVPGSTTLKRSLNIKTTISSSTVDKHQLEQQPGFCASSSTTSMITKPPTSTLLSSSLLSNQTSQPLKKSKVQTWSIKSVEPISKTYPVSFLICFVF